MRSLLTTLLLFGATAHAVPAQFTHQGRLLDADGKAILGDATITFRVTDSESGGTALWEETLTMPLTGGFYSAVLGASEDNPLDTATLAQAPVWLELQLEGEGAMFPRSPIHSVPYATMATVAEEVSGGPVDATAIAVDGTPVINELGEWVGPAPIVNWTDIEDVPADFADGIDDDTDTDTDSFAALGTSCLDGDIPFWDAVVGEWACDMDQDMLASIGCVDGQIIRWSGDAVGWVCADDADTMLSESDVDAMVSDNGYAMASEVFSGSFLDLVDVAPGLADGDDDTQLTADEVDAMVADNGYALAADAFSRLFSDLSGIPEDLADGDDNTQLTEDEVDAMVVDNGYASAADVFAGGFSDLTGIPSGLTDGDNDTLNDLSCADGEAPVFNESTELWECTAIPTAEGPSYSNIYEVTSGIRTCGSGSFWDDFGRHSGILALCENETDIVITGGCATETDLGRTAPYRATDATIRSGWVCFCGAGSSAPNEVKTTVVCMTP